MPALLSAAVSAIFAAYDVAAGVCRHAALRRYADAAIDMFDSYATCCCSHGAALLWRERRHTPALRLMLRSCRCCCLFCCCRLFASRLLFTPPFTHYAAFHYYFIFDICHTLPVSLHATYSMPKGIDYRHFSCCPRRHFFFTRCGFFFFARLTLAGLPPRHASL